MRPRQVTSALVHLLVVRHAQPEDEAGTDGHGDPPLSELGLRQAGAVCDYLHQHEQVDRIVASPMVRARQTGEPLTAASGLDMSFDDDLKEAGWNAGPYLRTEENMDAFMALLQENPDYFYEPEGKAAFTTRVLRAFSKIAAENAGKKVAVFCHGMVTSTIVEHALAARDGADTFLSPDYTAITRLQVASNLKHWTVESFNEHQHLRAAGLMA